MLRLWARISTSHLYRVIRVLCVIHIGRVLFEQAKNSLTGLADVEWRTLATFDYRLRLKGHGPGEEDAMKTAHLFMSWKGHVKNSEIRIPTSVWALNRCERPRLGRGWYRKQLYIPQWFYSSKGAEASSQRNFIRNAGRVSTEECKECWVRERASYDSLLSPIFNNKFSFRLPHFRTVLLVIHLLVNCERCSLNERYCKWQQAFPSIGEHGCVIEDSWLWVQQKQ